MGTIPLTSSPPLIVALPKLFVFKPNNAGCITWGPILDGVKLSQLPQIIAYINNASLLATLYIGRDRANWNVTPGTMADANISAIPLVYVVGSNGLYQGLFNAPSVALVPGGGDVNGVGGYVLTITSSSPSVQQWDEPAIVEARNK